MDLKTRYTALMTLISQFIKFSGETLKRLEEEEVNEHNELNGFITQYKGSPILFFEDLHKMLSIQSLYKIIIFIL